MKDLCHDQIAHFKIPRQGCFVEDYPVTVPGKIQKFVMRQPDGARAVCAYPTYLKYIGTGNSRDPNSFSCVR